MIKDPITKMSLLSSLAGIALLYLGAMQMQPSLTPISQIDEDFVGLKTKISGQVIDLNRHQEGHVFLKVKDKSGGVISVPVFEGIASKLDEGVELLDNIQITGRVESYGGELEIIPDEGKGIQIVHAPPIGIFEIDHNKIGEMVKVRAIVVKKKSVGNGNLLLDVRKDDEEITVFVPRSVADSDYFPRIREGDAVQIIGIVQLYKGKLELKVEGPNDLEIIGAPR